VIEFGTNATGVEVQVHVGSIGFTFAPSGYASAGEEIAYMPIIHDPMMRAIVHAALLAAAERLERQS